MSNDRQSSSCTVFPAELKIEIEQFLFLEARYIDEQQWRQWLDLFQDEAIYWMPTDRHQEDPFAQASIIYEDKLGLELRVQRRGHPQAHSLDRLPESTHLISNIMLDEVNSPTDHFKVSSSFIVLGYQEDIHNSQSVYGGRVFHDLASIDGELKIKKKKVVLNNCDAPQRNIQLLL